MLFALEQHRAHSALTKALGWRPAAPGARPRAVGEADPLPDLGNLSCDIHTHARDAPKEWGDGQDGGLPAELGGERVPAHERAPSGGSACRHLLGQTSAQPKTATAPPGFAPWGSSTPEVMDMAIL